MREGSLMTVREPAGAVTIASDCARGRDAVQSHTCQVSVSRPRRDTAPAGVTLIWRQRPAGSPGRVEISPTAAVGRPPQWLHFAPLGGCRSRRQFAIDLLAAGRATPGRRPPNTNRWVLKTGHDWTIAGRMKRPCVATPRHRENAPLSVGEDVTR